MTVTVPLMETKGIDVLKVKKILLNESGREALPARFRALFFLKNIGGDDAVETIGKGMMLVFLNRLAFVDPSVLLKHELAYVLGQMKVESAVPVLSSVLADHSQDPMVRHEAAEALGAIALKESIPTLELYLDDPEAAVRETCEIAIDRIRKAEYSEPLLPSEAVFESIDPAPSLKAPSLSIEELRDRLLNDKLSLYDRYKALFALRNRGGPVEREHSVLAICDGFNDQSALFRHEIAYVLGQLQHPASIPALEKVLSNCDEIGMVRHEAAEALGSIATLECNTILAKFIDDPEAVVRESCMVALDMYDYENSDELNFLNPEH